ncbi:hypothetical protein EPUL_005724 [Erysiphe pulchra]|uniref:Uncharacterized protein n=1 Tax=Erysiphe pulchra TaxID=225359 RepID=A0A2S4PM94_9PEZI|nr:hypothetical protein EPUL_005724 [Erysiphe pulchra]
MKNGHYIKCKQVDEAEPSNVGQNEDSYECGHEFFSHKIVQMSANLAQSNNGKNKLYHNPYYGPLFWPESVYYIYPISREKNHHYGGKKPENIYFVVINPAGQIIDVVAELRRGDFIQCARTTIAPPDIESDEDLRLGYLCGLIFFKMYHMERTADLAKVRSLHQERKVFPQKYNDHLSEGYIYPLFPNGMFYGTVSRPLKYFIVMDMNFKIKYALVKTSTQMKPCEATMRGSEDTPPETDNFFCEYSNTEFKNEVLLENVELACKALGSIYRRYPAIYNGPAFDVVGPYVTMPLKNGKGRSGRKNSLLTPPCFLISYQIIIFKVFLTDFYVWLAPPKFRVVMNTECMLAGVIEKYGEKIFKKCLRSKDNSIPGDESEMAITETHIIKDRKCIRAKKASQVDAWEQD